MDSHSDPFATGFEKDLRDAGRHNDQGARLAVRGDLSGAILEFREALRLVPDSPQARTNLANALTEAGTLARDPALLAEAIQQQQAAAKIAPDDPRIRRNLGNTLARAFFLDEAAAAYRAAISLDPSCISARVDLGTAIAALGQYSEALAILDEALQLHPGDVEARFARGGVKMAIGDPVGAWPDLEARFDRPEGYARRIPGVPIWKGEPCSGALVIHGAMEGVGDLIQGLRFVPEIRSRVGSVVLLCRPDLVRLVSQVSGLDRIVTDLSTLPPVEKQVAPMSLPAILGVGPNEMRGETAYLSGQTDVVTRLRSIAATLPGLKVGIVWQGNPSHPNDPYRSFPITAMEPLAAVPGVQWVALQWGQAIQQADSAPFPVRSRGLTDPGSDWMDTANAVSVLDLVIGPDSALIHLAGALGMPAWLALSTPPEWRWTVSCETTPWYHSVRLFRQPKPGDWRSVFEQMAAALARLQPRWSSA